MALTGSRDLGVTPSLLDRLIDLEPKVSTELANARFSSLGDLKKSIRRDLEWLLNSRRMVTGIEEISGELKKSIISYGIPDVTGVNIENITESSSLRAAVEASIRTFEPRFLDVSVSMEPLSSTDRQIRLKIEAKLDLDPIPEPMIFDTVLQLGSGTISITEGNPS